MTGKIVNRQEFRDALLKLMREEKGEILGTLAAASVMPRLFIHRAKAAFGVVARCTDYVSPVAANDVALGIPLPECQVFNEAAALQAELASGDEKRDALVRRAMEALPDYADDLRRRYLRPV